MEGVVYILCGLTALACSGLLWRGYRRSTVKLLLWAAFFFLALAFENAILFVDLVIVPQIDLSPMRNFVALAGVSLLLYSLIWDNP